MPEETETVEQVAETTVADGGGETQAAAKAPVEVTRPQLESKVKAGLASVFSDDEPAAETEETTTDTDPDPVEDPAAGDAGETEAAASTEEEQTQAPVVPAAAAPKPGAPTLPDAFRRSLKAYEWTDEEIDANLKAFGPKFIETAAKLHGNRNKELADWAAAGRASREQQQQPQDQQEQQPRTEEGKFAPKPKGGVQALKAVDIAALKKKYGDDDLFDAIMAPVNATIEQLNQIIPSLQNTQKQAQQAQLETLGRQIEGFFTGKPLDTYKDLYGDAKQQLQPEQLQARNKVLQLADDLILGARHSGRQIGLDEALMLAHDSTSGDFKAKAARAALTKTLAARAKGISLKPTGKKPAANTKPGDRSALEKKVKLGLAAAFSS